MILLLFIVGLIQFIQQQNIKAMKILKCYLMGSVLFFLFVLFSCDLTKNPVPEPDPCIIGENCTESLTFKGIKHTAIGSVSLSVLNEKLEINHLGSLDVDMVKVEFPENKYPVESWTIVSGNQDNVNVLPEESVQQYTFKGTLEGDNKALLARTWQTFRNGKTLIRGDFSPMGAVGVTINLYGKNGELLESILNYRGGGIEIDTISSKVESYKYRRGGSLKSCVITSIIDSNNGTQLSGRVLGSSEFEGVYTIEVQPEYLEEKETMLEEVEISTNEISSITILEEKIE